MERTCRHLALIHRSRGVSCLPFVDDDYYHGVGGDHHDQREQPGHREDEHEVEELLDTDVGDNLTTKDPDLVITVKVSDSCTLPVLGDDRMVPQSKNKTLKQNH